MFIDSSAVVAIINAEPGYDDLSRRIEDARGQRYISPLVRFEAATAIARSRSGQRRPTASDLETASSIVASFCDRLRVQEITITPTIGNKALDAAASYGKYTGNIADLNFGDCFSYACAKAYNARLVYKGNDFSKTDLA